jgi:hypothetical protein
MIGWEPSLVPVVGLRDRNVDGRLELLITIDGDPLGTSPSGIMVAAEGRSLRSDRSVAKESALAVPTVRHTAEAPDGDAIHAQPRHRPFGCAKQFEPRRAWGSSGIPSCGGSAFAVVLR